MWFILMLADKPSACYSLSATVPAKKNLLWFYAYFNFSNDFTPPFRLTIFESQLRHGSVIMTIAQYHHTAKFNTPIRR